MSIISQRWSPFCAIVVRQQVTVNLFEGLKARDVPSVGICKILTARALNRDMGVSRTSWHGEVILGRNSESRVFLL